MAKLDWLRQKLGYDEYPLGVSWTDQQPEGLSPKAGKKHDCILKYMRIARKTGQPAFISQNNAACRGGAIYSGFAESNDMVARYVSETERYLPNVDSMRRFFADINIEPANGAYCQFKPLKQFGEGEEPQIIVFFARGEVLSGLCQLACFALDDHNAVVFPFGSGCSNILSWPLTYARKGQTKAVLGGADPSCRPYMDMDEWSFAVTADVLEKMLEAAPDSFLDGNTWRKVAGKIARGKLIKSGPDNA